MLRRFVFGTAAVFFGLTSLAYADPPKPTTATTTTAPVTTPPPSPQAAAAAKIEARKLSDGFVSVADSVSPAVVQIDVTAHEQQDGLLFRGRKDDTPILRGTGSGVLFSSDGAILTNNHVIDNALTINVKLKDGRIFTGKLLGRDPSTDLAVIKIDGQGLTAAKFGDSDAAKVGEWVVAIGSPLGLSYTVTTGVLSAKGRGGFGMNAIEDYLQTDASINPGNSGGPLCDLNGNVLGINTMVVGHGAQGIGFAVPSSLAKRVAEQIQKKGRVERAWIGVGIQDLTPELANALKLPDARAGVLINKVEENGPAAKANMKPGDVIAAVAGKKVADGRELRREILAHDVGQTVALEIVRDGKHYGSSALLTAMPEAAVPPLPVQQQGVPSSGLGLSVRDLTAAQATQLGVGTRAVPIVTHVTPGSAADRAGLKPGDVIVEADGAQDPTATQLADAAKDGQLLLRVRRRELAFYAAMKK
jgi:S1-C subfamily serine protease